MTAGRTGRPSAADWLVVSRPNPGARLRLICLPYGGGGASAYHGWGGLLGPEVEVAAVRLPGRESRFSEPPFTRLLPLVRALTDALSTVQDRPFVLFGHSVGALVAFELTRELRRRGGAMPSLLVVSGRSAPQLPPHLTPIHELPDDAFVDEVRRFNGLPEQVLTNAELLALVLPTLRADFALHETYAYAPEPPLPMPIVAFGGDADHEFPLEGLDDWREQTSAGFDRRVFEGDHFFINSRRQDVMDALAQAVSPLLA